MGLIRQFIALNVAACKAIERRLPDAFTRSLLQAHELKAADLMNAQPGQTVLDVGGGRNPPFARHRKSDLATRIVALDIDLDELLPNDKVDAKLVADATRSLPFADDSVDLILTRSVLEHLSDPSDFHRECRRVLKPGGSCVHVCPSRRSPFALINRVLPDRVAQRLLYFFFPQWIERCGFKAYYKNCTHGELLAVLQRAELAIEHDEVRYYQSIYYRFFLPLYLMFLAYDLVLWGLRAKALGAQLFVVARKDMRTDTHAR